MNRLVCMLLVLLACSRHQSNELPDEAWGVADYASEGLRIDTTWTADDYAKAAATLQRIAVDHRERLPRFHGPKSGAVFAKLVADLPDDSSLAVDKRYPAHVVRSGALKDLLHLYTPNPYDAAPREAIDLAGAELRESALLASNADAFIATFGPDDPSRATRLDGLEKMRHGYSLMLLGCVMMAADKRIADADRAAMLDHVAAVLPALFPYVNPDTQTQVRDLLAKYAERLPDGPLRTAATAARRALPN